MRILIDAHMVGENETGNETYIVNLVAALAGLGSEHEFIIAAAHDEEVRKRLPDGARVRIRHVSANPARRLLCDLPALARRERADVMHVTYFGPLVNPCPVVVTVHDMSYRTNPEWFSPRDRFVLGMGIALTVPRASAILTVSAHSREDIVRLLGVPRERVHVTYCAPAAHFAPPDGDTAAKLRKLNIVPPYVLAVGNLQPRKNLLRLIEAFAVLKRCDGIPHKLVLVGKGKWRESEVFDLLKRESLVDSVIATGFVENEDLPCLYHGAEVFAYPSLYEGYGLPVIEAMACGTPVVTSSVSSIPEVAGDAAVMVDPLSVQDIAGGMRRLIGDPAERERLSKAGLEQARRFSWRKSAEITLQVYMSAAGASQASR